MAQDSDCPDRFTCLTPDPKYCLSAEALEEHEANLNDCQSKNSVLQGRLKECRDGEAVESARIEELVDAKADWKTKARDRRKTLEAWYHNEWIWVGIVSGVAAASFAGGFFLGR